jgi:hypothetical protein
MEFERTPVVEEMETSIHELNESFAKHTLRGGLHQGYIRIFQNGDDPDFNWNKGGRLYSQPFVESYQVMSAKRRARRIRSCSGRARQGGPQGSRQAGL